MLDLVKSSAMLFFRGKLFSEPGKAYRQLALGIACTAIVMTAGGKAGLPVWAAALVAGFAGGALQPYLFKNLRYR